MSQMSPSDKTPVEIKEEKVIPAYDVRVFSHSCQGGRKYMEDAFCVAVQSSYEPSDHVSSLPQETPAFIYAGIFDGHGGKEAALFAKDKLLQNITDQKEFWTDDDNLILEAIRQGFLTTHQAMLNEQEKWPLTPAGLLSTSGTTASICIIKKNKCYTGHVGDSRIILGRKNRETGMWIPHALTRDHKPDSPEEKMRIAAAGGEVMNKSGVDRVVWYRPKNGHKGPVRRSTNFDRIPFLAVARSLGDLWSYNPDLDTFIVSPDPDVAVVTLNPEDDKCLILASDGLWNMLLEHESIRLLQEIQEPESVDRHILDTLSFCKSTSHNRKLNPSQALVEYALEKWNSGRLRADNTSAVTLFFESTSSPNSDGPHVTSGTPFVLPLGMSPSEYLISRDGSWRRVFNTTQTATNMTNIISPDAYPVLMTPQPISGDFSLLSPSMQSLCTLANRPEVMPVKTGATNPDGGSEEDEGTTDSNPNGGVEEVKLKPELTDLKVYVNEMPDESFEALSSSLRLNPVPKMFKVINGVKVFRDPDADVRSLLESDVKFRDESCSVTEVLVDRPLDVNPVPSESLSSNHLQFNLNQNPNIHNNNSIIRVETPVWSPVGVAHVLKEMENGLEAQCKKMRQTSSQDIQNVVCNRSKKRKWRSGSFSTSCSPPAKHLRSSRWSRGNLRSSSAVCKRWKIMAASILTKSRLRAKSSSRF